MSAESSKLMIPQGDRQYQGVENSLFGRLSERPVWLGIGGLTSGPDPTTGRMAS
jgi:hypothetical protein